MLLRWLEARRRQLACDKRCREKQDNNGAKKVVGWALTKVKTNGGSKKYKATKDMSDTYAM